MGKHHEAWLLAHPHRSADWLSEKLKEGFDIHHLDGNHENNDPANLVLIEHTDHMILHGGRTLGRLKRSKQKGGGRKKARPATAAEILHILADNHRRVYESILKFNCLSNHHSPDDNG